MWEGYAGHPAFRRRFAQKMASAQRIHGLFAAQVVDSGMDAPTSWLATAGVPGPSLRQVVRRRRLCRRPLPVRTVLLLAAGIAEVLEGVCAGRSRLRPLLAGEWAGGRYGGTGCLPSGLPPVGPAARSSRPRPTARTKATWRPGRSLLRIRLTRHPARDASEFVLAEGCDAFVPAGYGLAPAHCARSTAEAVCPTGPASSGAGQGRDPAGEGAPGRVRAMASRSTQILEASARVIARRGVRGLRVEELAAEAGVSTALIYYHFKDRTGILLKTLEFISDRAERYTTHRDPDAEPLSPREELDRTLLLELQDTTEVRENSSAWGELRASAVFDEVLREDLARATLVWIQEVAALLGGVRPTAPAADLAASAERLTALLEGLSMRWLSGTLRISHARTLMSEAIEAEVERLGRPDASR